MSQPKRLTTPKTDANDQFANILQVILGGKGSLSGLANRLSLPQYGGDFTAGLTPLQLASQGLGTDAINNFDQGGYNDVLGSLRGAATGDFGSTINDLISGAKDSLSSVSDPGMIDKIYNSLNAKREVDLARDQSNTRESLSQGGLRFSTALADAYGQDRNNSQATLDAQISQIIPQLLSTQTGAAGKLGDLAASLIGGEQGAASGYQSLSGLPLSLATAGQNLGEGARGVAQSDLTAKANEFIRTNGALLPLILQYLGGTQENYGPSTLASVLGPLTGLAAAGSAFLPTGGGNNGKRGSSGTVKSP